MDRRPNRGSYSRASPKDPTANRLLKDKPNVRETVWVIENFQGEQQGMFKKVRSARPQGLWRAERTHSTRARQRAENAADALFQHPFKFHGGSVRAGHDRLESV